MQRRLEASNSNALYGESSVSTPASPWSAASDEALLKAMAEGLSDPFDELFSRYSALMLSFISRLLASNSDPEDLLQETFLRVLTHAKDFRPGSPFKPWLFTIARNAAYNSIKKSKLRGDLEVQTDLSDWNPPALPGGDPGARMELQEQKVRLLAALDDLPAPHREIIVLTIFEGFSYEEAAAITGELESTLRSRVFHALKKLRDRLKEH